jgi:glycosyltransferase involved in cell wall biosynthesis
MLDRNNINLRLRPVAAALVGRTTVGVIIPTHNHARFLGQAISSVLAQTRPADEIIVIDDGSTDHPEAVVYKYSGVQLIQQENLGKSAARNAGLRSSLSSHVVFLDADDRLLPHALEMGLKWAAKHPECAFIYGAHRDVTEGGDVLKDYHYSPISGDHHLDFSRRNLVRMQASVVFRRDCLMAIGGFDETLELAEDYDLYLRLARDYSVASHPSIVAEYRRHGRNASDDVKKMLKATLTVIDRHEARIKPNSLDRDGLQDGRRIWREHYTWMLVEASYLAWPSYRAVALFAQAMATSPSTVIRALKGYLHRCIKMPRSVK